MFREFSADLLRTPRTVPTCFRSAGGAPPNVAASDQDAVPSIPHKFVVGMVYMGRNEWYGISGYNVGSELQ